MLRKVLMSVLLGGMLTAGLASAEVVIRVGPPHAVRERRGPAPGRGYVWTPGYHRWNGNAYTWSAGQWVLPPHPRQHWVPARWVRRPGGWVFVEGHWR